MMEQDRRMEIAYLEGFAHVEIVEAQQLEFRPEFRTLCEENECGNYNRNYGCPPYCGTTEEMQEKVKKYKHALVMQSKIQVDDVMDKTLMKRLKKEHTARSMRAVKKILEESGEERGLAIMAGPCNLCETCKMQSGEPCIHEDLKFSCLSAYCIDINKLAETCQMEISWMGNPVSFFSIYCY